MLSYLIKLEDRAQIMSHLHSKEGNLAPFRIRGLLYFYTQFRNNILCSVSFPMQICAFTDEPEMIISIAKHSQIELKICGGEKRRSAVRDVTRNRLF